MRVVAGRRSLGSGVVPAPDAPFDGDEPTLIKAMSDFDDVVSSDGAARHEPGARPVPDFDADTVLDDRSVDELFELALGTNERPLGDDRALAVRSPPVPIMGTGPFQYPLMYGNAPPVYGTPPAQPGAIVYMVPPTAPFVADMSRPYPLQSPVESARSSAARWLIPMAALLVTAALGIVLGRFMFTQEDEAASTAAPPASIAPVAPAEAPASAAPTASPVAVPSTAAASPPTAAPGVTEAQRAAPAPAGPIEAAVTALGHPGGSAAITSPVRGEVVHAYLTERRKVSKDDKLFEIEHKTGAGGHSKQLAARVKELEKMAADDPVYKPFLDKARREYAAAGSRSVKVLVRATAAATLEPLVREGDSVSAAQAVAGDPQASVWTAKALLAGVDRPDVAWHCTLRRDAGEGAPCRIAQIIESDGGVEVAVTVDAAKASWLRADQKHLRLVFEPADAP